MATAAPQRDESLATQLARLPEEQRRQIVAGLSDDEVVSLLYDWQVWARPKQLEPAGTWRHWFVCCGRGFGKTRTGAEWVRHRVRSGARKLIFAAPTANDLRRVMIEGESGILAISPFGERPIYEPSKLLLTWPNGAQAVLMSADRPARARGKQCDTVWAEEVGSWRYPEMWDQIMFGFRVKRYYGAYLPNRSCITTTPEQTPLIEELLERASKNPEDVRLTSGSTFENSANLDSDFLREMRERYEGTRLGRQELYAELLGDVEGALWNRDQIEALRIKDPDDVPDLVRIVVAIDPNASSEYEVGIVVAGRDARGHCYVLEDVSGKMTPDEWGRAAVGAYKRWGADRIIGEVNQGGEMVEHVIRTVDPNVAYKAVRATDGKRTRAEPIAALAEQGRFHHVGYLAGLEKELCGHDFGAGKPSPNRLDAIVWAGTELMLGPQHDHIRATSGRRRVMAGGTGGF